MEVGLRPGRGGGRSRRAARPAAGPGRDAGHRPAVRRDDHRAGDRTAGRRRPARAGRPRALPRHVRPRLLRAGAASRPAARAAGVRRERARARASLLELACAVGGGGRPAAGQPPPGRPRSWRTKSSPTDVVTETDRAAETLIRERIGAARPGDGSSARRAGNPAVRRGERAGRREACALDRGPAGRHGQLPVRPARLGGQRRRRGGRHGGGGRGVRAPARRAVQRGARPGRVAESGRPAGRFPPSG